MPYQTIADLPAQVKALPKHAQEIFRAAFNSTYDGDEQKAFRIAWAAVKRKYRKDGDKWVLKEAQKQGPAMKTEGGQKYGADCYLVVPDPDKPSTWKLRIKEIVDGKPTVTQAQLGRAAAALSPGGFRGNRVELSEEDRKAAIGKLRRLYRENGWEMPESLKEAVSYDELRIKIRNQIDPPDDNGERTWRFSIEEVFPGYCVVRDNREDKLYRVEYSVDASDNVTIGQWQEAEYVLQVKPGTTSTTVPLPAAEIVEITESAGEGDISGLTPLTEAPAVGEGKAFRVTVLKPGWNVTLDGEQGDKYYTRQACASLVPLLEGAQAYADHPTKLEENQRPERSIRDLVGWYSDARQEPDGRTTATLHVLESAAWLRSILKEAPHLVGLSIYGFGTTAMGTAEGRRGKIVESIKILRSTDIVTRAAAGGAVEKLIASAKPFKEDDIVDWSKITLEELKKNRPDLYQAVGQERLAEARGEIQKDLDALKTSFEQQIANLKESAEAENKRLRDELQAERNKAAVKSRISDLLRESKLPEVSQKRLATLLEARDFTKDGAIDEEALKEAVTAAINEEREYLSKLTESGKIIGMGSSGEPPNPADKAKAVQDKLDRMFGLSEPKPAGQQ